MSLNTEWRKHTEKWIASGFENSPKGALDYFCHQMFIVHAMKPLTKNGSHTKNKAKCLWEFRNEIVDISASELKCLAKLSGKKVDHEALKKAKQRHADNIMMTKNELKP